MNYAEVSAYLLDIPKFTRKNTLQDTKLFLKKLGNPCQNKKIIHVAGTNGKGSVCAYLTSILETAGYRCGLFTSPHLVSMRERFRIDGEWIGEEEFLEAFQEVQAAIQGGIEGNEKYHPTFFEMLFFMAMVYFDKQKVDILVLETGLGGRLDATNAVEDKLACVITEIGLDHVEYLGNTIGEIAHEKAGIMRSGVPVIFADRSNAATEVLEKCAEVLRCQSYPVSKNDAQNLIIQKNSIDFSYETSYYGNVRCVLKTQAQYQIENAMLAVQTLSALGNSLVLKKEQVEEGLTKAKWEGRMEEILPDVFVDGAHNFDGIRAFLDTVANDECKGRRFLLFSAVKEKQYSEMIQMILGEKLFEQIFLTQLKNARGLTIDELRVSFEQLQSGITVCCADTRTAMEKLIQQKQAEDRIYVVGSLYLVGEIKELQEEFA